MAVFLHYTSILLIITQVFAKKENVLRGNNYLDSIFNETTLLMANTYEYHVGTPLQKFGVVVPKSGKLFSHDLEVDINEAHLLGLEGLHREDNCTVEMPSAKSPDVTLTCSLSLRNMRVSMKGNARGWELLKKSKSVSFVTKVTDPTRLMVVVKGRNALRPSAVKIYVDKGTVSTELTHQAGSMDLSKKRLNDLCNRIGNQVVKQLEPVLTKLIAPSLEASANKKFLPYFLV